jgi:hypothetical protein
MTDRRRLTALRVLLASAGAVACCASAAPASASTASSPLPFSDYGVRALCSQPAPGHAACMALELVPRTAEAHAHSHPLVVTPSSARRASGTPASGAYGYTPAGLHTAYTLPTSATAAQTIAIVDAYNDPTAAADLNSYSKEFGLPECTVESGCFKQINEQGEVGKQPFPKTVEELQAAEESASSSEKRKAAEATGWGVEISLDIESAHAVCENCKIVLVDAISPSYIHLEAAERAAESAGVTEISNSWGGPEQLEAEPAGSPFNHPGTVITASAGDDGYLNWDSKIAEEHGYANFPASSPHVVSVGGTRLEVNETTGAWQQEAVWNGDGAGGGGCSEVFAAPAWQRSLVNWSSVGCGEGRAVADVSADADPYKGVAVLDTDNFGCEEGANPHPGWCTIGGTSLASPVIAATFALAGGAHSVSYPARTLYENETKLPEALHDVVPSEGMLGANGQCSLEPKFNPASGLSTCSTVETAAQCGGKAICLSGSGYDGPTGVGSPDGVKAFEPPAGAPIEEKEPAKEEEGKFEEIQKIEEIRGRESGKAGGSAPVTLPVTAPTTAPTPAQPTIQIYSLGLTLRAIVALNHGHPVMSRMGFSFASNAPVRITATLSKRVRVHGRVRWKTVGRPLTGTAAIGLNNWHMRGGRLKRGSYRLTLSTAGVSPKSIAFVIG